MKDKTEFVTLKITRGGKGFQTVKMKRVFAETYINISAPKKGETARILEDETKPAIKTGSKGKTDETK